MVFSNLLRVLAVALTFMATASFAAARQSNVTIEPLLKVELPAAAIPDGPVYVNLAHWTWEPDATASIPAGAWQRGIVIDHVLSGSYTATSGEAVLLVRGAAPDSAEEIAPETEFVVDTGVGAAYMQNASSWEFRNGGDVVGAGLGGGIFSTAPPESTEPAVESGIGYEELARTDLERWSAEDDAATFTYWSATLEPGAEIPAPADGAVQLVALQPGSDSAAKLTVSPEGAARNDGAAPVEVFGLTLEG